MAPLDRDEPLLEREALLRLRVDAAVFERAAPPAFAFDPDAFEERFFGVPLPDADLLVVAIR